MDWRIYKIDIDFKPGTNIDTAFKNAVSIATKLGQQVNFTFNGIECLALPDSVPGLGVLQYNQILEGKLKPIARTE